MAATGLVQARVDEEIKEQASAILAAAGLTMSDAIRLMLVRVVQERALPFQPWTPNAETIEAMLESRKGGLPSFLTVEDLMSDLNEGD